MSRSPFRLIPHTADLRVEVRGRDLPSLFASSVEALFSLLTDRRRVRGKEERTVRVGGRDDMERLFLMLREAFFLYAVDGYLCRRARVTMKGEGVTMTASGELSDVRRHPVHREIKAVTAHALTVEKTPRGFVARFVVDV